MSDRARIEVDGLDRLDATLGNAADDLGDMGDANRATGTYLLTRARADAPVRTGRLAGSLRVDSGPVEVEVSSGLAYAARTHFGYARYGQRAQPFLYDALADGQAQVLDNYTDRVDKALDQVKGA